MKKYLIMTICFFAAYGTVLAAPTAGEVQRSIELLDQNQALMYKFEQTGRILIREIEVKANILIDKEDIGKLVLPYERNWLTKKDLGRLIRDFRQFCVSKGYLDEQIDIFPEIIADKLEININISQPENKINSKNTP